MTAHCHLGYILFVLIFISSSQANNFEAADYHYDMTVTEDSHIGRRLLGILSSTLSVPNEIDVAPVKISEDGSIVVFSMRTTYSGSGTLFAFKNISGTWTRMGGDAETTGITGKALGTRIAITSAGTTMVASMDSLVSGGLLYIYDWNGTNWNRRGEISGNNIGISIDISDDGMWVVGCSNTAYSNKGKLFPINQK